MVNQTPGTAPAADGTPESARPAPRQSARPAARQVALWAWRGVIQALTGPDPAPSWRWRSPWQRRTAYAALGATTLVLFLASQASIQPHRLSPVGLYQPTVGWHLLTSLIAVAPLPLAARYPLLGWRIGWLGLLLVPLAGHLGWGGWPWGPVQLLVMLAVFCVAGFRHQRPVLWSMWALTLIPWWLWLANGLADLNGPVSATIAFTAVTIALDSIIFRRRAQRALVAQTERIAIEQAQRTVLEERTRIARELHDVVAHHMSLIAVRAETAPYRLSDLPEPVRAEFQSLSEAAREALADMRRLLGVLRYDQPAGRAPQPQLSDLPALVDAARQAGVLVELSVPQPLDRVPAGVGVCAYRIVQESLSNVGRHAPGAVVTVSVDHGDDAVLLRVANGPGGPAEPAAHGRGPGQGLLGMRERVALLGGWLSAGPAPDGGFVVAAVLPLGDAA